MQSIAMPTRSAKFTSPSIQCKHAQPKQHWIWMNLIAVGSLLR